MDSANMSCPSFNASVPSVASNSSIVAVPSTAGPGFPHSIIPAQSSMSNAGQQINNATGAWVIPQSNVDYQGPITDLEAWNHGFYSRRRPNWRLAPSLANISYIRSLALPLYIAIQQTADVCDQLQKKSGKPATAVIWMQKKVWKEEDIWLVSWKLAMDCLEIQDGSIHEKHGNVDSGLPRSANIKFDEYPDFQSRYNQVHKLYWKCKAACKNLLDEDLAPASLKSVATPELIVRTKDKMSTSNKNRQTAKEALEAIANDKLLQEQLLEDKDEAEEDGESTTVPTHKREAISNNKRLREQLLEDEDFVEEDGESTTVAARKRTRHSSASASQSEGRKSSPGAHPKGSSCRRGSNPRSVPMPAGQISAVVADPLSGVRGGQGLAAQGLPRSEAVGPDLRNQYQPGLAGLGSQSWGRTPFSPNYGAGYHQSHLLGQQQSFSGNASTAQVFTPAGQDAIFYQSEIGDGQFGDALQSAVEDLTAEERLAIHGHPIDRQQFPMPPWTYDFSGEDAE